MRPSEPAPSCVEGIAWLIQRVSDRRAAGRRHPADRIEDQVADAPVPTGTR